MACWILRDRGLGKPSKYGESHGNWTPGLHRVLDLGVSAPLWTPMETEVEDEMETGAV